MSGKWDIVSPILVIYFSILLLYIILTPLTSELQIVFKLNMIVNLSIKIPVSKCC